MKTNNIFHYSKMALGAASLALLASCGGEGNSLAIMQKPLLPNTTVPDFTNVLSEEEIAGLKFMREEEKLARDVYVAMYNIWGRPVFANIVLSETTHTESILKKLIKYGIPDPTEGKAEGEFENPDLQDLYDTLIAMGTPTLIGALTVGALIEETDIHDIEVRMAATTQADILQVYGNLLSGSCNHLRAFNTNLLSEGITYVPQVISQAEWDAVVDATSEKCD